MQAPSPRLTLALSWCPWFLRERGPRDADQMYKYVGYIVEVLKRASGLGGECTES
ncbi:MAG: hypothetical protein P8I46_05980 [Pseudomonadales bacterium]|nr:hypothetical protein [Pseudomonadales bacterium]